MPEFLEDPSALTKDKLKTELLANNVSLPSGEQRKDVYVQLYLKHLTARNRGTPDFSSDEEKESTPMRGRGRPPGKKATKKTDKPRPEETGLEATDLSNEALKDELIKYGVVPGPIISSTRKVYEQRLLKLKEQASVATPLPLVADVSTTGNNNKQNGNTDSEHYSDNEEEPKIELAFEKREPLRGKAKAQVTLRNRKPEQAEIADDTDDVPELNVKRSNRSPPVEPTLEVEEVNASDPSISEDVISEPALTPAPPKSGRLQAVSKESTRISRRTPRKRDVTADSLAFDADISVTASNTETIMPSSNQMTGYTIHENFETRQVPNQSFKHTETLLSVSDYSDFARRTPKKQLMNEKVVEKTFLEEKRADRDVLKEMFPLEISTPTGISASCRRPIRGAAGRPLSHSDSVIEERYTSKYLSSKYTPVVEVKAAPPVNVKSGRSVPIWIKILLFVIVAVFSFLVYQAMESNEVNPFTNYLKGSSESSKIEN
uniref:Thymopoietin n=1 Tax=Leptobrachium leishanense TaxID=445787 RepID=A0A8C5PQM9_9ANUR